MYIIAKTTGEIIEVVGPLLGASAECSDTQAKVFAIAKAGGVPDDYSIFKIADGSINQKKISAGENFELIWDNTSSPVKIIDISFAKEESMSIMRFMPQGPDGRITDTLVADGIDYLTIICSIWFADLSGIDTSFNKTLLVPLYNPIKKLCYVKATFVNGISQRIFKTTEYGVWNIPLGYKFDEANVKISYEQVLDLNALFAV